MEKVIFSNQGGLGIIAELSENEDDFIDIRSIHLNGSEIKPGNHTDLFGMFEEPVRFVGLLKDDVGKCMVFYLGEDITLFESKKYYSCFYWINENRILNKYKEGTARDFIWVNNKWK